MAAFQTHSTSGTPLTVIYPAERPSRHSLPVRLRIGKKTVLPAYTDGNLPHLVQFKTGQQTVMFTLEDVLQTSYWRKIRNAYNLFGQLDIESDIKVDRRETKRVAQWLKEQSAACGIACNGFAAARRPTT